MYERLIGHGGRQVSARRLGGKRAGTVRIGRFLHNPKVTVDEMVRVAGERTCARAKGRDILAIQDSSALRVDEKGLGLSFHPVIAVDAGDGALLGLVDCFFLKRVGGERGSRRQKSFEEKDSRRWLDGAESASRLAWAGAASVTVVEDREGDIYPCFALKPAGVEKLVRAAQDRRLGDGSKLFAQAQSLAQAGRMQVDLPARPGQRARRIELSIGFGEVSILRPQTGKAAAGLPPSITVRLVVGRELNPPAGAVPAVWFLLTTHPVNQLADACRIIGLYRMRWTIEQLFRTMKSKGFQVEALRQQEDGPLEKLVTAILIAAITVMQLVAERDGKAGRLIGDLIEPADRPLLRAVCRSLEGKTQKQKNPHPETSLAHAAWVMARLGGWDGYYGKPGPIVILSGLTQFNAIKHGWALKDV